VSAKPHEGTAYRVEIPGWKPVGLNELMRLHWASRRRRLNYDASMVSTYAHMAKVPRAQGRRRVSVRFVLAGRDRVRDEDNTCKGLYDSLVRCGALVDDSPRRLERGPVVQERGARRLTEIVLEDVD
jgi:hypothetical protein